MFVKSYTRICNDEERTINVYYEESKHIDSTNYIYDKYSYERCKDCTSSECPVYKFAPQQIFLPR